MDAPVSDDETETREFYEDWRIMTEADWGVSLRTKRFRHPRVLLAYFRFVCLHNEIALHGEEIEVPEIPHHVVDFILAHPSFKDPPAEFKSDIEELKEHVLAWKERVGPPE